MDNKQYVLSLSYGKDSIASIHVVKDVLKMPLDRIVTVDIWFDDDTPADLPEVWEFKKQMDKRIKDKWNIEVEHLSARERERESDCVNFTQRFSPTESIFTGAEVAENIQETLSDSQCNKAHGAKNSSTRIRTYKKVFYRNNKKKNHINGFPIVKGQWCNSELKVQPLNFCVKQKVRWCST